MELNYIPFTKLLKQELPTLAQEIINTAELYDPEALKINVGYDRLVGLVPTFKLISQPYGAHHITAKLVIARKKCLLHARSIANRTEFVIKENAHKQTDAMLEANIQVNRYLNRLYQCKREKQVYKQIEDFLIELSINTALTEFTEEFLLTPDIDKLRVAQQEVTFLLLKRKSSISGRSKLTRKQLADPIEEAIKFFFKEIEVVAVRNPELNYEPLVNDLNETVRKQRNSINLRDLNNKRKAQGLEVIESIDQSTATADEPISMMRSLDVDETTEGSFEKKLDNQLDEKKTAASSSKQSQLPALDNKG